MHYSKFSVSGRKCSCTHRTQIKGINQYIESPLQLETDHISSPAFEGVDLPGSGTKLESIY